MKHRIILDTDMGTDVDDALCLSLALASPEIELVAVTTVSGDTGQRARIAARLLELAGRSDVPVHAGIRETRTGTPSFFWHGQEGEGILPADASPSLEEEPAVDAIARLLRTQDGLEVVAVGPLTNLAAVLDLDPTLAAPIARLTVMGGHLREIRYGDTVFPRGVDYNLCSDPQASLRVLRADIPTRLVTGDVTLQTWLRPEDLARIEAKGTPLHGAIARAIRIWGPIQERAFGGFGARIGDHNVAFLHDPLALACVGDESFCGFEDLAVEPAIEENVFRTIERPALGPNARVMRCATSVEAERFRDHFMTRVLALGS